MSKGLEQKFTRRTLFKFVLPTIIMMAFMSLYTIVDGIFVSRYVGGEALAAMNIILPVPSIIWAITIMFATGSSAIISKHLGEGKEELAKREFSFILVVNLILGIILSFITLFFLDDINRFLGGSGAVLEYANQYLRITAIIMPITFIKVIFDYFYAVIGKPTMGVVVALVGGVANIILDYVFLAKLGMGIEGAALATAIGQILPLIIGVLVFINKKNSLYFTKPIYDFKMLLESSLNGASEMIINLSGAVTAYLFNMAMLKAIGADGVAAITIVLYAQYLLISIYLGVSAGTAPIISYKYGEDDRSQLRKVIRYSYEMIIISSIVVFISSYFISSDIIGAFVQEGTAIYQLTEAGFGLFAISFLFIGANIYTSGMFTAFSNGKVSAIISFVRTFLFVIIGIVILPQFLGLNGIWLTLPFAEVLTIIISIYYIIKNKEKYHLVPEKGQV
ncbi:MAG: MATE family efflux transporter [Sarcina sp.]